MMKPRTKSSGRSGPGGTDRLRAATKQEFLALRHVSDRIQELDEELGRHPFNLDTDHPLRVASLGIAMRYREFALGARGRWQEPASDADEQAR